MAVLNKVHALCETLPHPETGPGFFFLSNLNPARADQVGKIFTGGDFLFNEFVECKARRRRPALSRSRNPNPNLDREGLPLLHAPG